MSRGLFLLEGNMKKKKGILLYGLKCQSLIWNDIKKHLDDMDIDFIEYPKDITKKCISIEELSDWIYEEYVNGLCYDFIIGHSMGGIIALDLINRKRINVEKTILIETFLKPPGDFYHNLIMDSGSIELKDKVKKMLDEEDANYTNQLKSSLRENFDYTDYVKIKKDILLIYGDRGKGSDDSKIEDLNLDKSFYDKITFIENSCHLPMLENPDKLAKVIKSLLRD